jgi:hypothetical protein
MIGGEVTTLGAWIKGRLGRRVRLEFYADGNVKKIEVRTPDEIRAVLQMLGSRRNAWGDRIWRLLN